MSSSVQTIDRPPDVAQAPDTGKKPAAKKAPPQRPQRRRRVKTPLKDKQMTILMLAVCLGIAFACVAFALFSAPEGFEDHAGFHSDVLSSEAGAETSSTFEH